MGEGGVVVLGEEWGVQEAFLDRKRVLAGREGKELLLDRVGTGQRICDMTWLTYAGAGMPPM